ncbi:hypothetical protein HDV06_006942 [Boothiomyces sp. JEL0866]|nr:hypothetical protein HDV06_006942 [Boothiomyces sp. JEL0866]
MTFVYYKIVAFYLDQKGSKTRKFSKREKELIKKAIIICLSFIVCWIPISCAIIYSEITLDVVGTNVDGITTFLMVTNSVINPYLLILLDARIKQNPITSLEQTSVDDSNYEFDESKIDTLKNQSPTDCK